MGGEERQDFGELRNRLMSLTTEGCLIFIHLYEYILIFGIYPFKPWLFFYHKPRVKSWVSCGSKTLGSYFKKKNVFVVLLLNKTFQHFGGFTTDKRYGATWHEHHWQMAPSVGDCSRPVVFMPHQQHIRSHTCGLVAVPVPVVRSWFPVIIYWCEKN